MAEGRVHATADRTWLLAVGEAAAEGRSHIHRGNETKSKALAFGYTTGLVAKPRLKCVIVILMAHVISRKQGETSFATHAGNTILTIVELFVRGRFLSSCSRLVPHRLRMYSVAPKVEVTKGEAGTACVIDGDGSEDSPASLWAESRFRQVSRQKGTKVYAMPGDGCGISANDTATGSLSGAPLGSVQVQATANG